MKRRTFLKTSAAAALATLPLSPLTSFAASMKKSTRSILGSDMAYVDQGSGRPVVFLHGNPTSSYLWRNIIPHITDTHRAIAPDLIGMGDSAKPDIAYTYADQAAHLHGLLDELDLRDAVLVIHDWGSGLGWHYARTRPKRVSAICFMEAMTPPGFPIKSLEPFGEEGKFIQAIRTPGVGEKMVLEQNVFIEGFLAKQGVNTPLSDEVMAEYRRPFPTPESRLPILQWPREIPVGGEPANVAAIVEANSRWILQSEIPKLMFHVDPGAIIPMQVAEFLKAKLTNLETIYLGKGKHYIQEDYSDEIGKGLADWLTRI